MCKSSCLQRRARVAERQRERQRQRDRETERQRDRETERQRDRESRPNTLKDQGDSRKPPSPAALAWFAAGPRVTASEFFWRFKNLHEMFANLAFLASQASPRRPENCKNPTTFWRFFVRSDFDTIFCIFGSFRGGQTLIFACPRSVLEGFSFFDIFNLRVEVALILARKRGQKSSRIVKKKRIEKHMFCGLDLRIDF